MRVIIIGAGLTGLSSALELSREHDVVLLEKEREAGGLTGTYGIDGYRIERYYHHMFTKDRELLNLINELGLSGKVEWKTARTGYLMDDIMYPLNTPIEILKFPYISFFDKIRLARYVMRSKKLDYAEFDDISCVEAIKKELGERIYLNFFEPLLRSKFGEVYREISYAWLLARVGIRSNRGLKGEKLGYMEGSFHTLITKMVDRIMERGGEIITSSRVKKITKNGSFLVRSGDDEIRGDAVISTIPTPDLKKLIPVELPEIKYQSSICVLFSFKEPVFDDVYWVNVKGNYPFGAIIEHTNFIPVDEYGEHLLYTASYSHPSSNILNMNRNDVARLHARALQKISSEKPEWWRVSVSKYSGVIYEKGYLKKVPDYRTNVEGLYIAGIFSAPNYPERSMNGSIISGKECARTLMTDFRDKEEKV